MKKKSSEFNGVPNNGVFVKSAIQVAVLLLSTGAIANAQDATPAAPAAGDIQTVTVTSTGTRGKQRTMTSTPVPVDVLSAKDLVKTGQVTLDKALQYTVPSFNTVQTPVNDATSLLDPYEIRNMGPSRSLILINGKRKNSSALIYTQTSPGRGESGADISAIPQDAIKRIEVLRDGASAQYGSDAISGVVNIILKDNASGGSVTARTGMTGERDGKMGGLSLNQGLSLGGKGFFNYTVDVSKSQLSSRSGKVSAEGEADPDFGFGADLNQVKAFLAKYPDARNINGSPETRATKFLFNTRYDLTDDLSIYGNAAYVNKKINSFANYRTPYWRPTDYGLLHAAGTPYEGYQPGFVGALDDYNATVGTKFTMMGWASDISLTLGGNKQGYTVTNSVNRDLAEKSPTTFDGGGSKFSHTVINADFSKELMASVNGYFGTELRSEKYETLAGEPASYFGRGSDSYAGNSPANSFPSERKNYGVYAGSSWDVSKQLLLDLTGRFEHYSDFGNATIGKLSGRYQFDDTVTLRSSISTGFRAPS